MATIREITAKCKDGAIAEAYEIALEDWNNAPNSPWSQREVGWALYYLIKSDVESNDKNKLFEHLEILQKLDQLTMANDAMIFENVLWKIAQYVKSVPKDNCMAISELFEKIKSFHFVTSEPYSFLLQATLKFDEWDQMTEFLEWWNFVNLSADDYKQRVSPDGTKMMSLAERAYIAYSKALLKTHDRDKIKAFIPVIEDITEQHIDMMYPGYYCGKLLLSLGADRQESFDKVLPFAKKKKSEFWVWVFLSEIFKNEEEKELACLLRAVHCHTQEKFIGKIRVKLAGIYVKRRDLPRAKFHIDKVTKCYLEQGWHFPLELQSMTTSPWLRTTQSDSSDPIDFTSITDSILFGDLNECYAIVTYIDSRTNRAALIYGMKKKTMAKFGAWKLKLKEGSFLKIKFVPEGDNIKILGATITKDPVELDFAKNVSGTIEKRDGNPFAFLKGETKSFVSPNLVQKYNLCNGDAIGATIVYNFNKKKNEWSWSCISINKHNI